MPHYDYDEVANEREDFTATIGGRQITLPKVLPAKLMLDMYNSDLANANDDKLSEFGFRLIEEVIGREQYEFVMGHIGIEGLTKFIKDVLDYYGLGKKKKGEEGEGKEETPEKEPERLSQSSESSSTSGHLTPISNGSTPRPDEDSTTIPSTGGSSSQGSGTFPKAPYSGQ